MKIAPWKTIQTNGCLRKKNTTTESKENSKQSRNGDQHHTVATDESIVGLTFAKNAILITRPRQISIVEDSDESVLQSSRPGRATSFSLPAVRCDPSAVFALQNGNQQLVCFKNNKKTFSISLESPAIQLAVLQGSMVFGTCQNGRIFVASIAVSAIKIQYLGEESTTKKPTTLAYPLNSTRRRTKRKRDEGNEVERCGICFLQQNADVAELVSYTWGDVPDEDNVEMERKKLPSTIPANLKGVVFLGALDSDVVCARYGDSVFSFSRFSGRLAYRALVLPTKLRSVCLAGHGNIAYISDDGELILVDVRRDMIVAREVIDETIKGKAHTVLTDQDEDRLVVISEVSNKISSVASTVLTPEDDQPVATLASTLESSMALEPLRQRKRTENVTDAVHEFESDCERILAGNAAAMKKNYLIESFSSMVERVKRVSDNGVVTMKNGKHHNENGLNGHSNGSKKEVSIPPQLVGPSTRVLIRSWSHSSMPKNDCRFILRRLIRSGYTSARNDLAFPDIFHYTANKSSKVYDESCYLPLELMHDVLDHCTDVSEGIMVLSLKFLMSGMSDEDIMRFFRKTKRKCSGTIDSSAKSHNRLQAMIDLFAKILDYSSCNDGILRSAMTSLLTSREMSLLVKMLVQFRQPTTGNAPGFRLNPTYMAWLTCLLDVVHETNEDEEHMRDIVRRWTDDELFSKNTMLALTVAVQQRLLMCNTGTDILTEGREWSSATVAGYQIERVEF